MENCLGQFFVLNGEVKPAMEFLQTIPGENDLIYEVIRIEAGIPLFLEDHLSRLETSIRLLNAGFPFAKEGIIESIKKLIISNKSDTGALKILLFYKNNRMLFVHLMKEYKPTAEEYISGIETRFFYESRENPNAKVWNAGFRQRTADEISRNSLFELVLVNPEGFITEGSRSNIFFIRGNEVYTAHDDFVLSGITRKKVLSVCQSLQIKVNFEMIDFRDVSKFDSAFFTGTTRIMVPVRQIENVSFEVNNPVFGLLKDGFQKLVKEYVSEKRQ
ncbi:MAG: aminotransferase class IV [Bacteroidales bacterium]